MAATTPAAAVVVATVAIDPGQATIRSSLATVTKAAKKTKMVPVPPAPLQRGRREKRLEAAERGSRERFKLLLKT